MATARLVWVLVSVLALVLPCVDATWCRDLDQSSCGYTNDWRMCKWNGVFGCTDISECTQHGTPTECATITSQIYTCAWNGQRCELAPTCSAITSTSYCSYHIFPCVHNGQSCIEPTSCSQMWANPTHCSTSPLSCTWMGGACQPRPTTCAGVTDAGICANSQAQLGFSCAWQSWGGCTDPTACSQLTQKGNCNASAIPSTPCLWMNNTCASKPTTCAGVTDATICTNANATIGVSSCIWSGAVCTPLCSALASQASCDASTTPSCAWMGESCHPRPTTCGGILGDQAMCEASQTSYGLTCAWNGTACFSPRACSQIQNASTCDHVSGVPGLHCLWHDGSAQCLNATSVACSTFTTMATGATLCPAANALNPAINCSWSSLASQCITRPTSCDTAPVEDLCTEQTACLWDTPSERCRAPTRCGEVVREDLCTTSPLACYWAGSSCLPIPTACGEIAQLGMCDASPLNCSWSSAASQCVPQPTSCSAAPVQDLCDGQWIAGVACEWREGGACRAVPTSCTQIATQPRCSAHANLTCLWMGDACYAAPTSCPAVVDAPTCTNDTLGFPCAWDGACRDPIVCSELRTQPTCHDTHGANLACLWMDDACYRVPTACASVRDQATCAAANVTLGFPCIWRANETMAPCEPPTLSAICGQFTNESTCSNATHRGCQWSSAEGVDACTVRAMVVEVDKEEEKSDSVDDVVVIVGAVAGASVGVGALAAIGVWAWKARAVAQAARASGEAAALVRGRAARIKATAPAPKRSLHRVSLV